MIPNTQPSTCALHNTMASSPAEAPAASHGAPLLHAANGGDTAAPQSARNLSRDSIHTSAALSVQHAYSSSKFQLGILAYVTHSSYSVIVLQEAAAVTQATRRWLIWCSPPQVLLCGMLGEHYCAAIHLAPLATHAWLSKRAGRSSTACSLQHNSFSSPCLVYSSCIPSIGLWV